MMRSNPLLREVLAGVSRPGRVQLDYLGLLLVQAVVVLLWWPRDEVATLLESQQAPNTLTALVLAIGATTAYFSVRLGAEEILLPGQHGLRAWAVATPLSLGRILTGYVAGQLVQSLHVLVLSTPLLLMAFTVSGGEWVALGGCLAAALVQALFYRLCGALTQLTIGRHGAESRFVCRAILLVMYVPVGFLWPSLSHVAYTLRALGEGTGSVTPLAPQPGIFFGVYLGLSLLLLAVLHALLARVRGNSRHGDRLDERMAT